MHLPAAISEALVGNEGEYAPFLTLARHSEGFDASKLAEQAAQLHLEPAQINRALLSAVTFADSLQT
jgi:EAL and modified HD-GYP domain-containing signal transduction protein